VSVFERARALQVVSRCMQTRLNVEEAFFGVVRLIRQAQGESVSCCMICLKCDRASVTFACRHLPRRRQRMVEVQLLRSVERSALFCEIV
jgi:hypothetical protein